MSPTPSHAWWRPVTLTAAVWLLALAAGLAAWGAQPEAWFLPGQRYALPGLHARPGDGYDGQFVLYMALEPRPGTVAPHLDVPAYRYQRVLLPWLAHWLAGGSPQGVLAAVLALNLLGHLAGTAVVAWRLAAWGRPSGWALLYGLWPGLLFAARVGLPEPLAYGLALLAWRAHEARRPALAAGLYLAAALTKEVTLALAAAQAVAALAQRRPRAAWPLLAAGLGWLGWQAWLKVTFGTVGFAAGGAGATGWEVVPLGGLLRVALQNPRLGLVYGLVFGPAYGVPIVVAARQVLRQGRAALRDPYALLLAVHLGLALFLPHSTWREPFAVLRVLTGLLLSFWLYEVRGGHWAVLRRLTPFWAAQAAFLLARG